VTLYGTLHNILAQAGDRYAGDPAYRLAPGSSYFMVGIVFRDADTRRLWHLRFVVRDARSYGVLQVIYADEAPPPRMSG
jgi:hypothetical protein